MSFGEDLRAFRDTVVGRSRATFLGSVNAVHGSIREGSEISGAPGQPIDTSDLFNSWQETYPEDWVGQTATNLEYAETIEHGQQQPYVTSPAERVIEETGQVISVEGGTQVTPGPMTVRSKVGGFHSVKLTRAAWPRLLEDVVSKVAP